MEEDVEIEILFKSNEKLLLEAVKETNCLNITEVNQFEQQSLSSAGESKSSCNKENLTENMVQDHEKTYIQLTEPANKSGNTPMTQDHNVPILSDQADRMCNLDHYSMKNSDSLSLNEQKSHQKVVFVEDVDDQVNQHIFDLIATDPVKYYFSQQTSYIEQLEGTDDDYESTDDDWCDDFGCKEENVFGGILDEAQFKSLKTSQFPGNKNLQKLETKATPLLTTLGKMLLKRGNFLSELEKKLQQLSLENKAKHRAMQDDLICLKVDKTNTREASSARCCFLKFGMPYFSDDKGFSAPPNKDNLQKIENDELIIQSVPKASSWTKSHKVLLEKAIKKTLIEEKSAKLTKEITKLVETVKNNDYDANKIIEKITDKQNELKRIYMKSYKELVNGENEDREYDWMRFSVSLFDGLHSAEECKRFWSLYLNPSINKAPWSESEDSKLSEIACKLNHQNWEKIADLLGTNRSGFQCFVHFNCRIDKESDFSGGKWTDVEDKKLLDVVNSSKIGNFIPWTKVSSYMGNRNHFQIYNRWANSLNPELVKGRFSKEEDLFIVAGVEVLGVTFKDISLLMKNRTSSQIRERYERYLLPKTAKVGTWSLDEDEKLLELVQSYGTHSWSEIAKEMKTRTRTQVRQRYGFIQKMMKNKPGWTVAQVKRRNISNSLRSYKTNKNVNSLKNIVNKVAEVYHLTDIEKETLVVDKLTELKDKLSFKHSSNRGRKRKEPAVRTEVDNAILDYLISCHTSKLTRHNKSFNDIDGKLNELCLLKNFLGHKIRLPKSEEEVEGRSRLSFESKCFLNSVLNSSTLEQSPNLTKQQCCLNSQSTGESEGRIDCPIPEHDDTIIMKDWWRTPPTNISNLNFSEFFKRTVFDYSNGLHKEIWDSKVKRSQVISVSHDCSLIEEGRNPKQHIYNFPPNQFTCLCLRSILLSRPTLEKMKDNSYKLVKEELNEDVDIKVGINLCSQLENDLLTLFTWPTVLAATKKASFPLYKVKSSRKVYRNLQKDLRSSNETTVLSRKRKVENEQAKCKLIGNDNVQSGHLVKKRKECDGSLDSARKRPVKIQNSSRSKCIGKSGKCTTLKENSGLNENGSSSLQQPAGSSCSKLRSYSRRNLYVSP